MCLISLEGCLASSGMASSPDGNDNGVCCAHSSVTTPSQCDLILRWRPLNPGRDGALGRLGTLHIWGDAGCTGQPPASKVHKPRSPSPGPAGRGPAAGTWIDGLSSAEPTQSRASRSSSDYALRNPYEEFDREPGSGGGLAEQIGSFLSFGVPVSPSDINEASMIIWGPGGDVSRAISGVARGRDKNRRRNLWSVGKAPRTCCR